MTTTQDLGWLLANFATAFRVSRMRSPYPPMVCFSPGLVTFRGTGLTSWRRSPPVW